jgi:hypothetical protein
MTSVAERDAPETFSEPAESPRRTVGRNEPCPCGSGSKYKKCCLLHERRAAQREHGVELPRWCLDAPRKLPQSTPTLSRTATARTTTATGSCLGRKSSLKRWIRFRNQGRRDGDGRAGRRALATVRAGVVAVARGVVVVGLAADPAVGEVDLVDAGQAVGHGVAVEAGEDLGQRHGAAVGVLVHAVRRRQDVIRPDEHAAAQHLGAAVERRAQETRRAVGELRRLGDLLDIHLAEGPGRRRAWRGQRQCQHRHGHGHRGRDCTQESPILARRHRPPRSPGAPPQFDSAP